MEIHGEDLKRYAENLHIMIGYTAKEPKKFEGSFLLLAMLMHLAESALLKIEEEKEAAENLKSLEESLVTGTLKMQDVEESLQEVVKKTHSHNAKAKIICSLIELEHICCIHPIKEKEQIDSEAFQEMIAPVKKLLQRDLSSIEATILYKTIENAKEAILSEKSRSLEEVEKLVKQSKKMLNGGL